MPMFVTFQMIYQPLPVGGAIYKRMIFFQALEELEEHQVSFNFNIHANHEYTEVKFPTLLIGRYASFRSFPSAY